VTPAGDILYRWSVGSRWTESGMVENTLSDTNNVIYSSVLGSLEQQSVATVPTITTTFSASLGTSAAFLVDFPSSRWYYYYEGTGALGTGSALLGYADAVVETVVQPPTSQPSSQPSGQPSMNPSRFDLGEDVYHISTLAASGALTVDVSALVGEFSGPIAVSQSHIIVRGTTATVSLPKSDLNTGSATVVSTDYIIVSNIASDQLYALGDADGEFLVNTGEVHCLISLHPVTGMRDSTKRLLWLGSSILIDHATSVYSGYNRVLINCGAAMESFQISLINGMVSQVDDPIARTFSGASLTTSGVVSFTFQHSHNMFYTCASGQLEEQNLQSSVIRAGDDAIVLGGGGSISADGSSNRWYFFYQGTGTFATGDAILGFAEIEVQWINPTSQPSTQPSHQPSQQPNSRPSSVPSSQPSSYPTLEGPDGEVFEVVLSSSGAATREISSIAGELTGHIAISSTRVFVSGTSAVVGLLKSDLSSNSYVTSASVDLTPVTNVANGQIFALGDEAGQIATSAGEVFCLIALSGSTGLRDTTKRVVWLTEPIYVPMGSRVYSGWNRAVVYDKVAGVASIMNLLNGRVSEADEDSLDRASAPISWTSGGFTEFTFQHTRTVVYAAAENIVERQALNSARTLDEPDVGSLGDFATIAIDVATNSWYFTYEGASEYGSGAAVVGRASMVVLASAPSSQPSAQPSGRPSGQPSSQPTGLPSGMPSAQPTMQPSGQPSRYPTSVDEGDEVFNVLNLASSGRTTVDVSSLIGSFAGPIAVTQSRIFVPGTTGTISLAKSDLNIGSAAVIAASYILVNNLANGHMYALGDEDGEFLVGSGDLTCLVPLDQASGLRDASRRILWLSEPIAVTYSSAVYSGHNHAIISCTLFMDSFRISFVNGQVSGREQGLDRSVAGASLVTAGIASVSFQQENILHYMSASGLMEQQALDVANSVRANDEEIFLGGEASITADRSANRWYYYFDGVSSFGSGSAMLGFADMIVIASNPTSQPSSQPSRQPSSQPSASPSRQPSSQPSSYPTLGALEDAAFEIALTGTDPLYRDIGSVIGALTGHIAVSSTRVFVSGALATVGLLKSDLSSNSYTTIANAEYTVVTNLANSQIFALADQDGEFLATVGTVHGLVALDGATGLRDTNKRILWLTQPIFLSIASTIHSGWNRLVLCEKVSSATYVVNFLNGRVESADYEGLDRTALPVAWSTGGISETTFHGERTLLYASPGSGVERQALNAGNAVGKPFASALGNAGAMSADHSASRWYFAYEGSGLFAAGSVIVGSAEMLTADSAPSSQPSVQPSGRPSSQPWAEPSSQPSSQPSTHPSVASLTEGYFAIMHLSTAVPVTRDVSSLVGAYNGNLAVSTSRIFVSGEYGTMSFPKSDLQSNSYSMVHANYSLVTNLANQQVYALGDSNADFLVTSGDLDCLIPIHATTGLRDPAKRILWLTEAIHMGTGSVVASGHNSVGIVEKATLEVYRINLRNGRVTEIDKSIDRWILPTPWLQSAVMEFSFEETHKLTYTVASGSLERQELTASSVVDAQFTATLGAAASICTDYLLHTWYYFYAGNGTFGQGDALLGSATMDALEINPTSRPSSQPSSLPSRQPSAQPSSQPSIRPFSHPTGQPSQQPTTRPSGTEVGMGRFDVLSLTLQNSSTVNVTELIGTFEGGIGVSPTHVFVTGSKGTVGLPKGSLDADNSVVVSAKLAMVTNLANQRVFALGDAASNLIDGAGMLHCLIPLDPGTGARNYFDRILWLSEPVSIAYGTGLYSGHNRLVVTDTISLDSYEINLENGNVAQIEDGMKRSP
jgi:hypothetical protein